MNRIVCLALLALPLGLSAQSSPPPLLFSGMDGMHPLDDGTELPFWGYGYTSTGILTLPGPFLEFEAGADYQLGFVNQSPEGHTIHLHGLDVDQSNDGVPSTSFTVMANGQASYAFSADYPGTFLYHCHVTTTLHLTMGMYGMLLVTRPDGTLWEGGPVADRNIPLLFSDLDRSTNLAPTAAYPFHTIRPDYFMVNGLSGSSLTASPEVAAAVAGERVALRLGSMAFAKVTCAFPASWNAEVVMTDGRPLPASFSAEALELYPGERYTVLIDVPESLDTFMAVTFTSMVNPADASTQSVWLNSGLTAVEDPVGEAGALRCFPNPATQEVFSQFSPGPWRVLDATGKVVSAGTSDATLWRLEVSNWAPGLYVLQVGQEASRFLVQ